MFCCGGFQGGLVCFHCFYSKWHSAHCWWWCWCCWWWWSSNKRSNQWSIARSWIEIQLTCCWLQRTFLHQFQKNMKALVAMATGLLNDDGTPMCDLKSEPCCSAIDKKKFTPKVKDLAAEIIHWAHCFKHNNIPRPTQWTKDKVMPWLIKHSYTDVEDTSKILCLLFVLNWQVLKLRCHHVLFGLATLLSWGWFTHWVKMVPWTRCCFNISKRNQNDSLVIR